jgi:hypothetical protein
MLVALACRAFAPAQAIRRAALSVHRATTDVLDACDLVLDREEDAARRRHQPPKEGRSS